MSKSYFQDHHLPSLREILSGWFAGGGLIVAVLTLGQLVV